MDVSCRIYPVPRQASKEVGRYGHGRKLWRATAAPMAMAQPKRSQRHAESWACPLEGRFRVPPPPMSDGHLWHGPGPGRIRVQDPFRGAARNAMLANAIDGDSGRENRNAFPNTGDREGSTDRLHGPAIEGTSTSRGRDWFSRHSIWNRPGGEPPSARTFLSRRSCSPSRSQAHKVAEAPRLETGEAAGGRVRRWLRRAGDRGQGGSRVRAAHPGDAF